LKASVAADAIDDEVIQEKLKGLQERQIQKSSSLDGDWLVLADKSGSMRACIETGRQIASLLAKSVKGRVRLVFFDTQPQAIDVTGKTYDQISQLTKRVDANGGTSVGVGMNWALQAQESFGGVVIVSDGGENTPPWFVDVYQAYVKKLDIEPSIYFYRLDGESDALSKMISDRGLEVQKFDLTTGVDYVSLPGIVAQMNTNRYAILDEVMSYPLLTLSQVLGD